MNKVWLVIRIEDGFPMDVYTSKVAAKGAVRKGERVEGPYVLAAESSR